VKRLIDPTASLNLSCLKDARTRPHVDPSASGASARQGHSADQPDLNEYGHG